MGDTSTGSGDVSHTTREHESDVRVRAILNAALDCIITFDPDERIIDLNPAAERTFGYTRSEAVGKQLGELLLPKKTRERGKRKIEHFLTGSEGSMIGKRVEIPALRKDGSEFIAELAIQPVPLEGELVFTMFLRDITKRKQAEIKLAKANEALKQEIKQREKADEALARERDLLQTLMDHLPDYVFVKDAESRFLINNKAHRAVLGVESLDEVVRKTDFDFFPQDLASQYYNDEQEVLHSKNPLVNREEQTVDNDGNEQWLITSKVPLFDATGSVSGLVGICRDITKRRLAELELKRYSAELERSNHDLDEFASVIAHDLAAPLRVITSYCKLLERHMPEKLDEQSEEFLREIVDATRRMQQLISDLRTFARVTMGNKPRQQVSCEQAFNQAISNLDVEIKESGALISHDPLPTLLAVESQLMQLFQNLINNAIKYASDQAPRIHIACQRDNQNWRISVIDNGIGIRENYHEHIFRIFQRVKNDNDSNSGSGVGLAICKRIVERHGGDIWVESKPGEGSTFHFTLRT